jgi:hypothetical protein
MPLLSCDRLTHCSEKGSETRKRIAKTTGDWADQLGHVFKKTRDQYNDLKDRARTMKSAAEQKVSNLKEDLG